MIHFQDRLSSKLATWPLMSPAEEAVHDHDHAKCQVACQPGHACAHKGTTMYSIITVVMLSQDRTRTA